MDRIFDTKVIINMEPNVENDIRDFLNQKSSYKDFKIEKMDSSVLWTDPNYHTSKVMVAIIYSYIKEV